MRAAVKAAFLVTSPTCDERLAPKDDEESEYRGD
jgi:hypothetical protein